MKKLLFILTVSVGLSLLFTSCGIVKSGSHSRNASHAPVTSINSNNEYDLDVADEGVTYTIDISTPEGASKLDKISLEEAEDLALTEALIKYNCASLINPQYTHLMKGKKVLRVTVFGFPARYRNRSKPTYDSNTRQQIDINVNRNR